jgi:hypothetical protein
MQRNQTFRVIGLRENGDRVVVTKQTNHQTAERVMSLMSAGTTFEELFIEADGDDDALAGVGLGDSACDDPALVEVAHG